MISIFYVCIQFNDFPISMSNYAQNIEHDWLYHICENNYNKLFILVSCKVLLVCYLQCFYK